VPAGVPHPAGVRPALAPVWPELGPAPSGRLCVRPWPRVRAPAGRRDAAPAWTPAVRAPAWERRDVALDAARVVAQAVARCELPAGV